MGRWLWCLVLLLPTGCRERVAHTDDTVVPLEQVPAAALKAARAKLPDVKFDQAWKLPGQDAFEVRGKTKAGKIHDVEVTSSGEILEVD